MWKVLLEMILLDLVDLSCIKVEGTSEDDPLGYGEAEFYKEEGTSGDDPIRFGGPELYKRERYFWK